MTKIDDNLPQPLPPGQFSLLGLLSFMLAWSLYFSTVATLVATTPLRFIVSPRDMCSCTFPAALCGPLPLHIRFPTVCLWGRLTICMRCHGGRR